MGKEGVAVGTVCGVGERANRFCGKAESSNRSSLEPRGRIAGKVTRGVYGLWRQQPRGAACSIRHRQDRTRQDKMISPAAQRPRDDRRDTVLSIR